MPPSVYVMRGVDVVKDTTSANIDQQSAVLQSLSGGGSDATLDEAAQVLALDLLVSVSGGGAAVGLLPSSIGAMGSTVDSLLAATSDNITAEFSTKVAILSFARLFHRMT